MDYLSNNVAVNLKRFRQSKSMSLDQMAERTGVSKSMLAQIERGQANPSLGVLGKITSRTADRISAADPAAERRLLSRDSTGTSSDQGTGRTVPGMDLSSL
ncbi:MAG: helix-turn-helix transcriptional regulator [Blautia sp.]